jgi:hypothetical protein
MSSGKEKDLLDSLGLVQSTIDNSSEDASSTDDTIQVSPSMITSDDSISNDILLSKDDEKISSSIHMNINHECLSTNIKRKSMLTSSNKSLSQRKQIKIEQNNG